MIRSMMMLAVLTVGLVFVSTAEAGGGCRSGYGGYGYGSYGYRGYTTVPVTYYRSAYRPVNVSPFYNTYRPSLYYGGYRGYGVGGNIGYGRYGYGPIYGVGF